MRTLLLWLCLTASAIASPPDWFFMPEDTREERAEREKVRLKWIRDRKIMRAMDVADARRQRVDARKASGYYIWLHYPHMVQRYSWWRRWR